ncbi:hypothetical protein QY97_03470 [Bacillus thermotolerans]|uniref:Uncharacterized protein n=1 Tax=Bacillus thermotolerans TaxID=1221996 RepID=A0A0F5I5E8_BACTR|nr:hypothetical protein QY97_03470 [Bacillus thermotolerans]KKB40756.1 hypothetical protein QY95_01330 [Bacillus thermotolerans]KKB41656.1 hypothetical protein QY96_01893 [Bacillus thermotolerans]
MAAVLLRKRMRVSGFIASHLLLVKERLNRRSFFVLQKRGAF